MTNKIVLREVEEILNDYKPVYASIFALFLTVASLHEEKVGQVDYKRSEAVGDLRLKHITPKDTEFKQIQVGDGKKTFKKYFFGKQYINSDLQDNSDIEKVIAQVLDENNKLADELLMLQEGSSAETAVNNGLFWSADANYTLESSVEVDKGTATDHLKDMHTQIMVTVTKAKKLAGRKVLLVYGSDAIAKYNSLYANSDAPFKKTLIDVMNPAGGSQDWSIVEVPSDIALGNVNGWIAVNMDQVKLHYMTMPKLDDQGHNAEKKYTWHNFLMGSMMLEVLVKDAIIRQPVTFEA